MAFADYNKAISLTAWLRYALNPNLTEAYINLTEVYIQRGNIYKYEGKPELALADYNQAISLTA